MVGHERLGTALDKLLESVTGDQARSPSVLRKMLRVAARALVAASDTTGIIAVADFYEVGPDAFPTGNGIDQAYDWMAFLSYGMLIDAEGFLSIPAYLEQSLWPRFDDALTLAVGGPLDKLARAITTSIDKSTADDLAEFVHSFRIYVACALLAADCPRHMIGT